VFWLVPVLLITSCPGYFCVLVIFAECLSWLFSLLLHFFAECLSWLLHFNYLFTECLSWLLLVLIITRVLVITWLLPSWLFIGLGDSDSVLVILCLSDSGALVILAPCSMLTVTIDLHNVQCCRKLDLTFILRLASVFWAAASGDHKKTTITDRRRRLSEWVPMSCFGRPLRASQPRERLVLV
jgi:hypothetical protein